MTRHVSGVFRRSDRVHAKPGTTVRVLSANRRQSSRARLLELGTADLLLTGIQPPPLGAKMLIAITLPGRYIEFEVEGFVDWHEGANFGVVLEYLSARQAYGISLARELVRGAPVAQSLGRAAGK
jgi:hypothetical protein